ncbi:sialate O-acetylesterase [Niabella sp. CC-SYL272]|uniref:sialate O-acetylesterase n=1 Tax=Niabella agricola TaxID=2891571 RepID=UPI001F34EAAF|nr:sialate O-acetylesterase [Niabella agricola]MCF3111312.1 sialate O-acetylesterase [Niabella agricola]
MKMAVLAGALALCFLGCNGSLEAQTEWKQLSGAWNISGSQVNPVAGKDGVFTLLHTGSAKEMAWESLSVDFRFEDRSVKGALGIMLNIEAPDDYQLLRIAPDTTRCVLQLLHRKYGYFRMWQEAVLHEKLTKDQVYSVSIVKAPAVDLEDWRPWKIIIREKKTGKILLKQGVSNDMPAFGVGQVGLYAATPAIVFSNFQFVLQNPEQKGRGLVVPSLFSDGMVLQHSRVNLVWGKAASQSEVELHIAGKRLKTRSDKEGKWEIRIPALPVTDSLDMEIRSKKDRIRIRNIAVGEVWMASGQSNMEMRTWQSDVSKTITAENKDVKLRVFKQPQWPSGDPVFSSGGEWIPADSASVMGWSAVVSSFGINLRKTLRVPVGIICAYWGGTAVESWFPRETLAKDPVTAPILKRYNASLLRLEKGLPVETRFPWSWDVAGQSHTPGNLYNGMIAPLVPYSIKGVLWYQGESNTQKARQYEHLFPMLIDTWRKKWNNPALYFFYVQLAGYDGKQSGSEIESAWPQLRDIQRRVLDKKKHTGMAVAFHLGDSLDIHPYRKNEIGLRLANLALHDAYGFTKIVSRGPLPEQALFKNGSAAIRFRETAAGLTTGDGKPLTGFAIAGEDQVFYPAVAIISGDGKMVTVSSDKVPDPVAVRYGWVNYSSDANLVNSAGLPASPFRTDNWKLLTDDTL